LSYPDLQRLALGYAGSLQEKADDLAIIFVSSSIESCALYLGALLACRRVLPLGLNLLLHHFDRFAPLVEKHGLFTSETDWKKLGPRLSSRAFPVRVLSPAHSASAPVAATPEIVLHTSSSTSGQTKAVLLQPDYLPLFFSWCEQAFGLSAADRFLLISPFHFDMSFFDFFLPLFLGATLFVPEPGELFYAHSLRTILSDARISVVHSVPSFWQALVTEPSPETAFSSIKHVLTAGDLLPDFFLKRLRSSFPSASFYNFYGQTEANSYLYWKFPAPEVSFPFPLGTARSYASVSEINGELVVTGPNVALGYLDADYETLLPFPTRAGQRSFSTGDVIEIRDGVVSLLGRRDAEVFLELRARVNRIPGVVQSVVVQCASGPTLFVQPESREKAAAMVERVERSLAGKIPIVVRGTLPLNYNGKVDRQQLAKSSS
jgi:acyl-CoA synthetase (AMP-forming)/AMP-acid ligase II